MKTLLALALVVLLVGPVRADIPDPGCCSFAEPVSGCIGLTPGGNGPSLASRGVVVTVHVRDHLDLPVAGYPFQDIWLDSADPSEITLCNGGAAADANTDQDGITTISGVMAGGGWTQGGMQVVLAGVPLTGPPLDLDANSPDLTGDLAVNISDVAAFALDFFDPAYDFRSDLDCDGNEDLADVSILAAHNGETCP